MEKALSFLTLSIKEVPFYFKHVAQSSFLCWWGHMKTLFTGHLIFLFTVFLYEFNSMRIPRSLIGHVYEV